MVLEQQLHLITKAHINLHYNNMLLIDSHPKRKEPLILNPILQDSPLHFKEAAFCKEVNQENPLNGNLQQNKPFAEKVLRVSSSR